MEDEGVSIGAATVLRETEKGLWVRAELLDGGQAFVPYSQIHEDSEVYRHDSPPGELIVSTWLATQRGWVDAW